MTGFKSNSHEFWSFNAETNSRFIYTDLIVLSDAGTTAATVLTRAIFSEGCKSVAAGMNAMDLRRGITLAVDAVVAHLKSQAKMISTSEEIAQVSNLVF
jgi:hypothetical protein